jgi:hypothetical protein
MKQLAELMFGREGGVALALSPASGRGDANWERGSFEESSDRGAKAQPRKKGAFRDPEKAPFAAGPRRGTGNFRIPRTRKGA